MGNRVFIVIPTYNEKENLPIIVEKIFKLQIPDLRILIVDDNSPDLTGRVADELAKKYRGALLVIHRKEKQGLGKAYIHAFQYLLGLSEDQKPDYIIEMDADLSHDPGVIPEMLKAIQNADLIIGSRYISGGKIENWNWKRRFLSSCANLYTRIILGLPFRDVTAGLRCYRRSVLERINLNSLYSAGYVFQIEMTYLAYRLGFRIVEIPITFTERKIGKSKIDFNVIAESFFKVAMLPFLRNRK